MKIKKITVWMIVMAMAVLTVGCGNKIPHNEKENKIKIMTTLFPYYDFARAVTKGIDNIEVELLVSPGQDDHSFGPTPADVVKINNADVFIYNGGGLETWVSTVLESLDNKSQTVIKMIDCVKPEIEVAAEKEEREKVFAVDDHDHGDENPEHEDEHHHEIDEHIWTSPVMAQKLVENICHNLSEKMPEYKDVFNKNSKDYINEIKNVDKEIRSITNKAHKKEIIFADKFPLKYFALEYGLKYYAAFDGCSGEMEPSAKTVAFLIDKVKAKDVHGIFYLELSSQAMADVICDDTGVKKYQFNSCHNITEKQFKEGITYVNLMKENANVLKKALNVK